MCRSAEMTNRRPKNVRKVGLRFEFQKYILQKYVVSLFNQDAQLILCQKLEHFECAGYLTAKTKTIQGYGWITSISAWGCLGRL